MVVLICVCCDWEDKEEGDAMVEEPGCHSDTKLKL